MTLKSSEEAVKHIRDFLNGTLDHLQDAAPRPTTRLSAVSPAADTIGEFPPWVGWPESWAR
jgi:hypothetical protein